MRSSICAVKVTGNFIECWVLKKIVEEIKAEFFQNYIVHSPGNFNACTELCNYH